MRCFLKTGLRRHAYTMGSQHGMQLRSAILSCIEGLNSCGVLSGDSTICGLGRVVKIWISTKCLQGGHFEALKIRFTISF